jgi:hypothetical protein
MMTSKQSHCVYVDQVVCLSQCMNKTIYIRDEDVSVWDRAKELAGDKLSPVIVDGLRMFISQKETEMAESKGFERIEISFSDSDDHYIPKKKAFYGKWVFPLAEPYDEFYPDTAVTGRYALALTRKGNVAVLFWQESDEGASRFKFRVYPSLERVAADDEVNGAATTAIAKLGVPVQELDI